MTVIRRMGSVLLALLCVLGMTDKAFASTDLVTFPDPEFQKIAEQGDAKAQFNLGQMYYYTGEDAAQNYQQAVSWYRKAAEQGYAEAQYHLGLMYYNGQGVPQDYQQAVTWYRKAAEQGDATAQYNLGLMHYEGEGVPQNYQQALAVVVHPP